MASPPAREHAAPHSAADPPQRPVLGPLRAATRLLRRQIEALAGQDPVRTFFELPAIGLIDAAVARPGGVVPLGDRPQGVALLDHVPAGKLNLDAGELATFKAAAAGGLAC